MIEFAFTNRILLRVCDGLTMGKEYAIIVENFNNQRKENKMKKLLAVFSIIAFAAVAKADCTWDWWFKNGDKDIKGCALGLASANNNVTGAQVSLCANKAKDVKSGAQVAIGYSQVDTLRNGVQASFITKARKASLQFGLVCFNEGGFLPVFVFFNFDKTMFGSK